MTSRISPKELKDLRASSELYALIDVREWGEFALEQIFGASIVPRGHLEKYVPFLVPATDARIILYCDCGERSARAAATLGALGYTGVTVLDGGLEGWKQAGGETVSGWSVPGKDYGERVQIEEDIPDLTVEQLHARLERGEKLYILDARPEEEFRTSHLPGAYPVPWGQMAIEAPVIVPDRDAVVIANCAGRTRSIMGARLLRRMGYHRAMALKGGTGAWRIAGYGAELQAGPGPAKPEIPPSISTWTRGFGARIAEEEKIPRLSPRELEHMLRGGGLVYVLDMRLPSEFVGGHLPGARLCPLTQAQFLADNLVGVRNAAVICTCDDGVRGVLGAWLLRGIGYPNACALRGGIEQWTKEGLATETGTPWEMDYGQPPWLLRFAIPAALGRPRPLPSAGFDEARARTRLIDPQELRAGESLSQIVLDVRGAGEFATAHIPGARWLSRGRLELGIETLAPSRGGDLVLYCRRGVESTLAAATASELGYERVRVLDGGFEAWKRAGFPVEEGLGTQSEFEEIAVAEVGIFGGGPYGFSHERMAKYLKWEEALGEKYRARRALRTGRS